jgi:hypothetical protein
VLRAIRVIPTNAESFESFRVGPGQSESVRVSPSSSQSESVRVRGSGSVEMLEPRLRGSSASDGQTYARVSGHRHPSHASAGVGLNLLCFIGCLHAGPGALRLCRTAPSSPSLSAISAGERRQASESACVKGRCDWMRNTRALWSTCVHGTSLITVQAAGTGTCTDRQGHAQPEVW